jgi:hypothetical protein
VVAAGLGAPGIARRRRAGAVTHRYGSLRIDTDRYRSLRIVTDRHGSLRIDTDRYGGTDRPTPPRRCRRGGGDAVGMAIYKRPGDSAEASPVGSTGMACPHGHMLQLRNGSTLRYGSTLKAAVAHTDGRIHRMGQWVWVYGSSAASIVWVNRSLAGQQGHAVTSVGSCCGARLLAHGVYASWHGAMACMRRGMGPWRVCVVAWGHGVYASCYRSHAHRSHTNLSSARAAFETFQKPIGLTPSHSIGVILWAIGLTSAQTGESGWQYRACGVEYRNCSGCFYLVSQVQKLLEFRDLHLDHLNHLTISRARKG